MPSLELKPTHKFITAFEDFCSLCRGSLNPSISIEAVEEMIIQHILTERIFRKVFDVVEQSKEFTEKGAELYAKA